MTELKVKFTKGFAKRATAVAMALCMGLSLVPSGIVANAMTTADGVKWKGKLTVSDETVALDAGTSKELTASFEWDSYELPATPTTPSTPSTPTTPTEPEKPEAATITWEASGSAVTLSATTGNKVTVTAANNLTADTTVNVTVKADDQTKTVKVTVKKAPEKKPDPEPEKKPDPEPEKKPDTPVDPKPTVVKVTKVALTLNGQTVTNKKLNVQTGKNYTLKAAISPSKATNKKVKWSTSNKKLATVSSKGVVSVKKKTGTVKITATAQDGSKKKAAVTLKIGKKAIAVSKVTIKGKKTMSLKKSKTQTLKVTVSPATVSNQKVTWKSSNKKIATVSTKGKVTAKKKGTVTITATSKANKKKIAKIKIKVNK